MPTLYHTRDARSFRALWMLEEIGAPYELVVLRFPPRVRDKNYLTLNPLGTVPLLIDGETRMTESVAICHYLATKAGGGFAVSPDEAGYGAYLNALLFGEATLTFPQTLVLRYSLMEPEERRQPQVAEDYTRWFFSRLRGLDAMLEEGGGYAAAGRFTAADVSVGYALMFAELQKLDDRFSPAVADYWQRLKTRDAFVRAKDAQKRRPDQETTA